MTTRCGSERGRRWAPVAAVLTVVVLAAAIAGDAPRGQRPRAVPPTGPYLLNGTGSPDPVEVMDRTGLRSVTFAFVTATRTGECRAVWNEWEELAPGDIEHRRLAAIRARGGDATISFGGADGQKLTQACASVDDLYDQYRRVIDLYRPRAIDVDIEGTELDDTAGHARTVDALMRIKRDYDVSLSITLPVLTTGIAGAARAFFDTARTRGLVVDNWTVMTFNYGEDRRDPRRSRYLTLVEATERSVEAFTAQVAASYGLASAADAHRLIGVSSMNGRTDHYGATGEVVTADDFRQMRTEAERRGLGRFTFWALNRDRPCTGDDRDRPVTNRCSHLDQAPGAFAAIAAGFRRGP